MKKVRITIPYFIKQSLQSDLDHFKISLSKLGNSLFKYYSTMDIKKNNFLGKDTEIIQFNLNSSNKDMYFRVLKEQQMETEAEYFRSIFLEYLSNPRYKREEIIFSDHFKNIEEAIKFNKKLNIKYKKEIRTVSPYFVKEGDRESSSYLFCYCEHHNDYRNYRICNLNKIFTSKLEIQKKDIKYIENVKKNFDPFNSFGKTVKVIFSEEGEKLYKILNYNRPKLIEDNGLLFTFQCSIDLGKAYFGQFLSEVEVVEPLELREWFKDQFKYGGYNYKCKRDLETLKQPGFGIVENK